MPCTLLPVFHLIPEATGDHRCLIGFIEYSLLAYYSMLLSDVSVIAVICLSLQLDCELLEKVSYISVANAWH